MNNFLFFKVFLPFVFYLCLSVTSLLKIVSSLKEEKRWYEIYLYILVFIYVTFYTYGTGLNLIKPMVTFSEGFSSKDDNLCFKEGQHKNPFFKTRHSIEKPIALSINNSFNNLVSNQYQVLKDKKTVYINFMFGNNEEENQKMAESGFIFDYETRLWIISRDYQERKTAKSYAEVGLSTFCEKTKTE